MKKLLAIPAALTLSTFATGSNAEPIGIFALTDGEPQIDEGVLEALECQRFLLGDVVNQQGPMMLGRASSFLLLTCKAPVLDDPSRRAAVQNLLEDVSVLGVFEGSWS